MWTAEAPFSSLVERNRWKVEFFCDPSSSVMPQSAFRMRPLKDLVKERKETLDPAEEGDRLVNYLGLENIKSLTGQLVNFKPRPGQSIKSRSKLFYQNDVLYGRLRPNLNKVYHATAPVAEGICSGEFFVFIPNGELINSVVLRYLLGSEYVQRHAARLQIGTALPRMNLKDLLEIEVPVPPLDVQEKYAKELEKQFLHMVQVTKELEGLPHQIAASFLTALERGTMQIR
jgi:restriction endonuclease S subunit